MSLVNQAEVRNFSAASTVDGTRGIAAFTASANTGGQLNFSMSVQDLVAYKANKEVVDSDYETFKENVEKQIGV